MLPKPVLEHAQQLVDAEFAPRSAALLGRVEALLRQLIARRGQGGHLQIEATALLAEEMRNRAEIWGQTLVRVMQGADMVATDGAVEDFRAELQRYANRDVERDLAAAKAKYPWLELQDAPIVAARQAEIEKQVGEARLALRKPKWYETPRAKGAAYVLTGLAALVAILAFLGVRPWAG